MKADSRPCAAAISWSTRSTARKEFIAGRDEYTINIAIVTDGVPILGIIAAPALGTVWRGIVGRGAERLPIAGGKRSRRARDPHPAAAPATNSSSWSAARILRRARRAFIDGFPHGEARCNAARR